MDLVKKGCRIKFYSYYCSWNFLFILFKKGCKKGCRINTIKFHFFIHIVVLGFFNKIYIVSVYICIHIFTASVFYVEFFIIFFRGNMPKVQFKKFIQLEVLVVFLYNPKSTTMLKHWFVGWFFLPNSNLAHIGCYSKQSMWFPTLIDINLTLCFSPHIFYNNNSFPFLLHSNRFCHFLTNLFN